MKGPSSAKRERTSHYRAELIEQKVNLERNVKILGDDLTFLDFTERERTKHVHRLHPYLGKFIPQIVELFLRKFFKRGDWILDPFLGSGTTAVEANALGMNFIGIELSYFNWLISKVKTDEYDLSLLAEEVKECLRLTQEFSSQSENGQLRLFVSRQTSLNTSSEYLNTWFAPRALAELLFYRSLIQRYRNQEVLTIILSRSARSARLIPHFDLARPKKPVTETYWCIKHHRYCAPIQEALKFITRYSLDTISRIRQFHKIRTAAKMILIQGDSRNVDLPRDVRFEGVFTSPPYVGMIDYHEQHRYAYELFNFPRQDRLEIGPMSNGQGQMARERYIDDMVSVLSSMNLSLRKGAKIFIVANDRFQLYPKIATALSWEIVDVFHRPVLMRTERDNCQYFESIYHMRKS